jgi:hypothetical protein
VELTVGDAAVNDAMSAEPPLAFGHAMAVEPFHQFKFDVFHVPEPFAAEPVATVHV